MQLRSEANKSAALAVKEAALKPFEPPRAGGGDTIGDTVEPSPGKRPRVEAGGGLSLMCHVSTAIHMCLVRNAPYD